MGFEQVRLGVSLLALVSLPWIAREANACSPAACLPAQLAPAEGGTVPANVPALPYRPGFAITSMDVPPELFAIVAEDGSSVPVKVVSAPPDTLVVPEQSLNEGGWYTLRYPDTCPSAYGPRPDHAVQACRLFHVGASASFPSVAPSFAWWKVSMGTVYNTGTLSGSCTTSIQAAIASFQVTVPDGAPFREVAWLETEVDDIFWARTAPGMHWDGDRLPWETREPTFLFAGCGPRDPNDDNGLEEGHHVVTIRWVLPGLEPPLMTATRELDLYCEPAIAEPGADVTSDSSEAVGQNDAAEIAEGEETQTETDTADGTIEIVPDAVPPDATEPRPAASGCASCPGGQVDRGPLFFLAVVVLLHVSRWRRRPGRSL